jgi:hypothetical protein
VGKEPLPAGEGSFPSDQRCRLAVRGPQLVMPRPTEIWPEPDSAVSGLETYAGIFHAAWRAVLSIMTSWLP